MSLKESGEMYLETIYLLSKKRDGVRSIDIAEHMNYSRPSVSRAVGLLKAQKLIEVDGNGFITLTKIGKHTAESVMERHNVLTGVLISLGVSEETAEKDACRIEHIISDETFEAVKRFADKE